MYIINSNYTYKRKSIFHFTCGQNELKEKRVNFHERLFAILCTNKAVRNFKITFVTCTADIILQITNFMKRCKQTHFRIRMYIYISVFYVPKAFF